MGTGHSCFRRLNRFPTYINFMKTKHELTELLNFFAEYATVQLGSGVHTSRVARNTHRIGEAMGVDVRLLTFQKSAIVSLSDVEDDEQLTCVKPIPALPVSFAMNSDLSALSWQACDNHLTFDDIKRRFVEVVESKRMNAALVTFCVGLANASFCRLFGGDWIAMAIVFVATVAGFALKTWLTRFKVNNFITIAICSFVASAIASLSVNFNCTASIALATSPLFLVPGVPLINGFIDIVEGYVLNGVSRLVSALLLIICIAVGLSITLVIIKNQLI